MRYNLDETKRKHPPHHHKKHHHHHHHSGDSPSPDPHKQPPWAMVQQSGHAASKQLDIGTVEHAIAVCYAALSSLPLRYDRITTLGMVLKMLVHENKLLGLNDVLQRAMSLINHYESVGDFE